MRRKYFVDEPEESNWDLNQERAFWERMFNQKINFFLIFFAIVIVGSAVANTKELTLFILSVGAVILWVLAVSLINTTRKINLAVNELNRLGNHPTSVVDSKAKGKITRMVIGFALPIFCASIITLISLAGLSGLYTFNFSTKPQQVLEAVQTTVEKGKESFIDKKKNINDESKYFEKVDSVIKKSKTVRISDPTLLAADTSKHGVEPFKKTDLNQKNQSGKQTPSLPDPHFSSIDKVVASQPVYSSELKSAKLSPTPKTEKQLSQQIQPADPHFKNIQQVKEDTNKKIQVKISVPAKKENAKQLPPDPHFQNVEKVIKEGEKKP